MSSTAFNIVGLIGSFIFSAALLPQIAKVYRTKSATDISYPYVCLYMTGVSCVAVYGVGESLWPIYIPSMLEFVAAVGLLTLKIRYDLRKANEPQDTRLMATASK